MSIRLGHGPSRFRKVSPVVQPDTCDKPLKREDGGKGRFRNKINIKSKFGLKDILKTFDNYIISVIN